MMKRPPSPNKLFVFFFILPFTSIAEIFEAPLLYPPDIAISSCTNPSINGSWTLHTGLLSPDITAPGEVCACYGNSLDDGQVLVIRSDIAPDVATLSWEQYSGGQNCGNVSGSRMDKETIADASVPSCPDFSDFISRSPCIALASTAPIVPTMSEWSIVILALILLIFAVVSFNNARARETEDLELETK